MRRKRRLMRRQRGGVRLRHRRVRSLARVRRLVLRLVLRLMLRVMLRIARHVRRVLRGVRGVDLVRGVHGRRRRRVVRRRVRARRVVRLRRGRRVLRAGRVVRRGAWRVHRGGVRRRRGGRRGAVVGHGADSALSAVTGSSTRVESVKRFGRAGRNVDVQQCRRGREILRQQACLGGALLDYAFVTWRNVCTRGRALILGRAWRVVAPRAASTPRSAARSQQGGLRFHARTAPVSFWCAVREPRGQERGAEEGEALL